MINLYSMCMLCLGKLKSPTLYLEPFPPDLFAYENPQVKLTWG